MRGMFNLLALTHNPNHLFPYTSCVWVSKLSMPTWCRLYEGPLVSRWLLLSLSSSYGTERTEQVFWYPLLWSLTTRAPASWSPLPIITPTMPSLNAIQLRAHPITVTWGKGRQDWVHSRRWLWTSTVSGPKHLSMHENWSTTLVSVHKTWYNKRKPQKYQINRI